MNELKNESRQLNIGIVTTWFERGAAYVSKAYMEILQKEHCVFIYARGGEESPEEGSDWHARNVTVAPDFRNYFMQGDNSMSRLHFLRWIKKNGISLVIFNEQKDVSLVKVASQCGLITGAYVDYYKKATIEEFDTYDFLLCNTQRHFSVFKKHKNPIFLQWGTDINLYKPRVKSEAEDESVRFFHSAGYGGFKCRKGTDLLVHAFQQVVGPAKLIIHSQVAKEIYGDEVAKPLSEDDRIEFIVKTVPAPGLYCLGDVYVYPSRLDGIGLSVPEALSSGLPVITTDCPPMSEFVIDGENGLLIEIDSVNERIDNYYWPETVVNVKALAAKMQRYVDDRSLLQSHKRAARESAVARFDWSKNADVLNSRLDQFGHSEMPTLSLKYQSVYLVQDLHRISTYYLYKVLKILRTKLFDS